MFIHFYYLLPILLFLSFIGSLFVVHMRKTDGIEFYAPWIGAAVLVNIAVLMNFSKIPLTKNIFNLPFFNGMTFIVIILVFIAVFSWIFIKKRDIGFREKNVWLYFFIIFSLVLFTGSFFNKLGDSQVAQRGWTLQTISLAEEMLRDKQIEPNQFEVGVPILVSFFTETFGISPLTVSRMIHGLFAVLTIPMISLIILKITKPSGKNTLLLLSIAVFVAMFILFPIQNFTINTIFMIGTIAFISNITFDYLKVLENTQNKGINVEEIVLAQAFLFLAVINGTAFKIGLTLFLILIGFRLLIQKNQLSYGWLRAILIMCLLNPLLLGIVFRF